MSQNSFSRNTHFAQPAKFRPGDRLRYKDASLRKRLGNPVFKVHSHEGQLKLVGKEGVYDANMFEKV